MCGGGTLTALQWLLAPDKGSQVLVWPGHKGGPSLEPQSLVEVAGATHNGQGTVEHALQNQAAANICAVVFGKQTAQVPAWEQYRASFNKGKATAQLTAAVK